MTTTDQVFLIILSCLLSLFFILLIALVLVALKLVSSARKLIARAEEVVNNVESATEALKDVQGRMAIFKLIRNIIKLVQRSRK